MRRSWLVGVGRSAGLGHRTLRRPGRVLRRAPERRRRPPAPATASASTPGARVAGPAARRSPQAGFHHRQAGGFPAETGVVVQGQGDLVSHLGVDDRPAHPPPAHPVQPVEQERPGQSPAGGPREPRPGAARSPECPTARGWRSRRRTVICRPRRRGNGSAVWPPAPRPGRVRRAARRGKKPPGRWPAPAGGPRPSPGSRRGPGRGGRPSRSSERRCSSSATSKPAARNPVCSSGERAEVTTRAKPRSPRIVRQRREERGRQDRGFGDRGEERHVAIAAPRPGASPLPPPTDDVD